MYVKAPICISIRSHTKFQLPLSITSWGMKRGPKIQDVVAVVRMRHLAEKNFNVGKVPMHVYLYTKFQLSNLINSRDMRGSQNPRWRRGYAHAPPSGKFSTC